MLKILVLFVVASSLCAVQSHAEMALVVSEEGLSGKASFGEVVEVNLSKSAVGVTFGGENYPAGNFAFNSSGCFEVGLSQGLGSVYEDAKFEGTGTVHTIEFTGTINPTLNASIEICPQVQEPFQLRASSSKRQEPNKVQPMAISNVRIESQSSKRLSPGMSFSLSLDAFCLDITKEEPEPGTELSLASNPLSDAYTSYLNSNLSSPDKQQCIWLSDARRFFSYEFDGLDPGYVKLQVQELVDVYGSKCNLTARQEHELRGEF